VLSISLTLVFVVIETWAGLRADSLALLTDAGHNLTDVMALALSWYAMRVAVLPANSSNTFGYHRVGILVALINSTTLALIAIGVMYEAYQRYRAPPEVQADILVGVGAAAFVVNLVTAWLVSHGREHDLNLRSAFLHLMGDVFSTLGAVFAGIGIWLTGYNWLDPLASVLIGLLILGNAWMILKETLEILLESVPRDIDMSLMVRDLLRVPGVRSVHDLHVWSLSKSLRMLSAHIVTEDMPIGEGARILCELKSVVASRYGIAHSTLQLECVGCDPDHLYCNLADSGPAGDHPHGAHEVHDGHHAAVLPGLAPADVAKTAAARHPVSVSKIRSAMP
jgi:cobalt-zinc-cadmium efflux system protein